jgi:hypothetical protein
VDGFNFAPFISPGGLEDFIDLVIPELQKRGIYKTDYEPGTFREKLFVHGQRLITDDHLASRFRHHAFASRV